MHGFRHDQGNRQLVMPKTVRRASAATCALILERSKAGTIFESNSAPLSTVFGHCQ
ncbi:hypothetical protein Lpl7_0093 [Lacticaseibacillus paracasei subsp. tolerans Lpl7]|nr:hypothetical protein Lpl7_0093 [Lacticaseibacillus paracasei subsp. tolerans Lpl7]